MPRRGITGGPNQFTRDGEDWPEGELADRNEAAPAILDAARAAQGLVRRLNQVMERRDLSNRALSRLADLDNSALAGLRAGRSFPDMVTVAKLERALRVRLMPEWRDRKPS